MMHVRVTQVSNVTWYVRELTLHLLRHRSWSASCSSCRRCMTSLGCSLGRKEGLLMCVRNCNGCTDRPGRVVCLARKIILGNNLEMGLTVEGEM